jgi:hypothetical protein
MLMEKSNSRIVCEKGVAYLEPLSYLVSGQNTDFTIKKKDLALL